MRIVFFGDIMGRAGRKAVSHLSEDIIEHYQPDIVIANCENSAGGFGVTRKVYDELRFHRIDLFTSGNHIWDKKETADKLDEYPLILRPANYPAGTPGKGMLIFETSSGEKIAVINLIGRVFLGNFDCPFRMADTLLDAIPADVRTIFIDFHAEVTSEKAALFHYLKGRVSAVIGTHTHVQTADERINAGTAFLSDAGMCGGMGGVIGMRYDSVVNRYLYQIPSKFEVELSDIRLHGVFVETDAEGKALRIERIARCLDS
ncbi:TIGR00282 family metallophosphoesterase [Chrysiogenes arsenatis]|uniref:TIGR00282 family metallophosphoesterase n=1 Tax=Chrysiogenes arsenatis TaxID=309797 RepID=UPI000410379D|nr:TIGR00282 family metallophosphoesterase [Chrysiogenes arsenatis]